MKTGSTSLDWSGVLKSWRSFWANNALEPDLMTRSSFLDVQIVGCDHEIGDLIGWWRKGESFDEGQAKIRRMAPERLAETKFITVNVGTRHTAMMLWNTRNDLELTATTWISATLLTLSDRLNSSCSWSGMEWVSTYLKAARETLVNAKIEFWAPRTSSVLPISVLEEFPGLVNLSPYHLARLAAFDSLACKSAYDIVHIHSSRKSEI